MISPELPVADGATPSATMLRALFSRAERLRHAAASNLGKRPLEGAYIALLHAAGKAETRSLLHKAIDRLGAKPVAIEFDEDEPRGPGLDMAAMARVLGRLYQAVDCAGLAPSAVRAIATQSGIPVFCGLGRAQHPVRGLGELWTIEQVVGAGRGSRRIRFCGDVDASPASSFVQAASRMGFELEMVRASEWQLPVQRSSPSDFRVDARDPHRWKVCMGAEPLDARTRSDNCACLIEAILLDAVATR